MPTKGRATGTKASLNLQRKDAVRVEFFGTVTPMHCDFCDQTKMWNIKASVWSERILFFLMRSRQLGEKVAAVTVTHVASFQHDTIHPPESKRLSFLSLRSEHYCAHETA